MLRKSGPRFFWRRLFAVSAFLVLGMTLAQARTFTAFGPQTYTRETGAPVTVSSTFSVLNPNTQYTLKAFNGGLQDDTTELVSSGSVTVNGVQVMGPNNFNQNVTEVDVPVTLQASNTIQVQVRGKPGGTLTIEIVGVDNDPPVITATASPAPNAANWNNTNVTVTFTCSDATSGVASCPAAQTITTEGANQVISGTATDNAGLTASASVTLNIDKTPPTITAAPSPTPNAANWNNSNVTVSFTCSDSLSGVATCPSATTVTTEGANQAVSGTATDVAGNTASTSVTVNLDKTPPTISITSPANGATFTSSSVSVSGTVSDALSGVAAVTCDGAAATVQSGSFTCPVTLSPGSNTITVTATDVAGNSSTASESITFSNVPPPAITSFSPASAPVGTQVTLTGSNFTGSGSGTPQVSLAQQGGGAILAPIVSFTATSIVFVIPAGAASGPVTVSVANQSGASTSPLTIQATSGFTISAVPGSSNVIQGQSTALAVSLSSSNGFTQLAALAVSGLPSGVTGTFSPAQITAGQTAVLTITAPAGQATGAATLTISASATVQGIPVAQSTQATLNVQAVSTTFLGRTVVQDPTEDPLAGVTITMLGVDGNGNATGCAGSATSDAGGNFAISNLPSACAGPQLIRYDGSTATAPPGVYAGVDLVYTFVAGQVTTPPFVIHLPRIDNAETVKVKQNASVDQTFTFASIPGLSVTVYAGTVFTLADGTQPDPFPLIAIQVPVDRLPDQMPMTNSTVTAFIVAFQPANTVASQPVAVTFPNTLNTAPGVQLELDTLDPTKGVMVEYGTGTVSSSATQIVPDLDPNHPGHRFGLVHFDWHGPRAPQPPVTNPSSDPNAPQKGDPVDVATGLLDFTKTDIGFGGARGQVSIQRTYRSLSGNPGPFGIGTNHNYGYLLDTSNLIRGTGTFVNLVMPDGNQFPFAEQGTNTFVNSTIPSLLGAVITNPSTGIYNLRWKNGTVYQFQTSSQGALLAFLNSITDSNGNSITLVRGNSSQPIQITQIIDPVGRALNLTYDSFNRILSITDPIGRQVQYTYNSQGTLATVTDPAGGVTTYAYDSQNRMTSITDPRGITFLQNAYDANGHVAQQTAADGGVTTFAYTLLNPMVATSPVLLTAVTDPRGNTTTYHFNPLGFLLDVTDPLGERTTYTLDPGTNQILSITDPLGRTAGFAYDADGNTISTTRLAGTPDAVTTTFTYDTTFNRVTSVTDPLGHTTSLQYDDAGKLLSITNPMAEQTDFSYDSNGELTSSRDALQNTTHFAYQNGDLVRLTDPLNRTTAKGMDAVSRLFNLTNAVGQSVGYQYDTLNRLTRITDPQGNQISLTYDGNGNLLSMADAKGNKTSYTYDSMDRLASRTDPLGHTETYQYDLKGNVTQFTDRRGVVTEYSYDSLNRRSHVNFGGQETIDYSHDAAGRIIQVSDSITGTIVRGYDGLDRLVSETTPQGNLSYTNDAAGRRTTSTISGQQAINFLYDNGDRLAQIVQGGSNVTFNYDADGRRTALVLPNSVAMNYSYDPASELTGINYTLRGSPLGNLVYAYDQARRRQSIGGSLARTEMPNPLTGASYNTGNQFVQFGSSSLSYDANGNLTSDGINTYTWNARNKLVSIGGGVTASFQYDAFGRRVTKEINGATVSYLYDGQNPVEELSGTAVTASLVTGLGVDEYFQRTDASGTVDYLTDALGSTVALTNSDGTLRTQYSYDPFGNTSNGGNSSNPYQYTGRENDGTGLYFYRARYYSPLFQRFIGEDPLGQPGGANAYAYTLGNPISFFDRFGLRPDVSKPSQDCLDALAVAGANTAGLQRAVADWDLIRQAATANGIDPSLLAAIGIRETDFQNIPQRGGGQGAGIFQIDLGQNPSVTSAQAYDPTFAANFAANMLATNMTTLAAQHPNLTPTQLLQATAASYNFGTGNISGNPDTIDVGSTGNNYGSNVLNLAGCFQ